MDEKAEMGDIVELINSRFQSMDDRFKTFDGKFEKLEENQSDFRKSLDDISNEISKVCQDSASFKGVTAKMFESMEARVKKRLNISMALTASILGAYTLMPPDVANKLAAVIAKIAGAG